MDVRSERAQMNAENKEEGKAAVGEPGYKAIEEMLVRADPERRFPWPSRSISTTWSSPWS